MMQKHRPIVGKKDVFHQSRVKIGGGIYRHDMRQTKKDFFQKGFLIYTGIWKRAVNQ